MNLPAILAILGLACYSALFYVVVSPPTHTRGSVRQLFLLSLVVMVAWQLSALVVSLARVESVAITGYQAMTAIVVAFGVSYALFVRTFLILGDNKALITVGGLLSAITFALVLAARPSIIQGVYWNSTTHFFLPEFGPLAPVVGVPYYVLLGYVVYLLLRGYRRAQQPLARSRIQYLLLGWCVVLLGTLANFVPSLKNYPIDLMANVANAFIITYAIFRYQLLDISLVIRKGLVYSIPTTIIAVAYFLIVYTVEKLLAFAGYQVFLLSLLVAALTAVAVQPLRDKAQLWIDRLFFREKYDAQLMLQELSELATSILDMDRLSSILLHRLTSTMHIRQASIILKEEETARFRLVAHRGRDDLERKIVFRNDHPVVRWLATHKDVLSRADMDTNPQFSALWVQERDELESIDAQLFIPLVARGELIGILVLGPKLSEISYSQDEQLTLTTLANQVAIAIENARLFGAAQDEIAERSRAEAMLRRRTARLELLREIDEAILEARPSDQTIEVALHRVRELLDCDGAGLVTLAAETGDSGSDAPDAGEGLESSGYHDPEALRLLQDGQVYVVDDLDAVSLASATIQQLRASGYRSALFVPVLQRQPQLVDTLVLATSKPGAFGKEEQEVGQELAHSLALAIRNTEMRREIRERAQALEQQLARVNLFNEITRAIAARHDLASILSVVAQRLEDDFTDQASIWLGDGDSFSLAAHGDRSRRSLTDTGLVNPVAIPAELPERQALLQGKVVYIPDLCLMASLHVAAFARRLEVRSAVIAPLIIEGAVFGTIISARRGQDAFSRAERDFLGGLGEHVAVAVQQARLHEDLEKAYNELRETQRAVMQQERLRALGEMASGIAHDINNAISPIPLYAGLIEGKPHLDEQTKAYLSTIKTAVRDVEETVGRMRQFYRKREDEKFLPVDVNPAVRQAIELTRPRWRDVPQEQGITIVLDTDFQDNLPTVMGNEGEIRQAVTNLVLNAVDAMPVGGTLTLRTLQGHDPSPHVIVEVIDTGIGMGEEILERAFEPFFSTKGARGSGMGLASVYGTMQRHGGDVQVASAPGRGTTMRLIFPMQQGVGEDIVEPPFPAAPPLRILYVDDEPLLREALKEALEYEGHSVELADGGQSGLEVFRAALLNGRPFEVVITDLGMPHVDGRKVARIVKEEAPRTPVILLTGWGQRLHEENEIPADVDWVLSKPPRIAALNQALARVIGG